MLEEAAWIDGASAVKSVVHVVLPLMLPGLFTVAMFTFVGSWGNFLYRSFYCSPQRRYRLP
ncbi:ABC transporter permease subunit [Blautia sp. RD014234]|nr:ABC transporter permease subunit [Blautia parvula]